MLRPTFGSESPILLIQGQKFGPGDVVERTGAGRTVATSVVSGQPVLSRAAIASGGAAPASCFQKFSAERPYASESPSPVSACAVKAIMPAKCSVLALVIGRALEQVGHTKKCFELYGITGIKNRLNQVLTEIHRYATGLLQRGHVTSTT